MTVTMERILEWKLLPRFMMAVMCYLRGTNCVGGDAVHSVVPSVEATALTATVTGAMTGAFAVWLGSEKK